VSSPPRRGGNVPRVFGKSRAGSVRQSFESPKTRPVKSSPPGRVALLGIAQRQTRANYQANSTSQNRSKPLSLNIKTAGAWLRVKRLEKNLTPGRVAAKIGIAASLVCAWENCIQQPEYQQLKILASILNFDAMIVTRSQSSPKICHSFNSLPITPAGVCRRRTTFHMHCELTLQVLP
jgi:DNA-binding transcriptional regulator YiaG